MPWTIKQDKTENNEKTIPQVSEKNNPTMTLYIQLIEQKLFLGPRAKAQPAVKKNWTKTNPIIVISLMIVFTFCSFFIFFLLMNILADYFTANTLLK